MPKNIPHCVRIAFGQRLAYLRRQRGMTQEHMAELVDVSPRHLRRLEAGEANPPLDQITALASALDVHVGALFEPLDGPVRRKRGRPKKNRL